MSTRNGRYALAALLCLGLAWAAGCGKKEEVVAAAEVKEAAPPRIVAVEPSFNAGKVKQGQSVEHVFKVKNEGGSDLILERAKSS